MTNSRFLTVDKLMKLLGITDSHRVQALVRPVVIPHLYIIRRQHPTRLYPTLYSTGFATYLNGRSATPTRAERFNAHPGTKRLMTRVCEEFEIALRSQEKYTQTQAEALLCVGHQAFRGWQDSGALAFEVDASTGRRIITSQMIRDAIRWALPS